MNAAHWLTYAAACLAVAVVPGPSLSLIIANTLRHGRAAGIASVAGTQTGFALLVIILAAGFQAMLATAAPFFGWLRIAGAFYLVWLGMRIILGDRTENSAQAAPNTRRAFTQGFLVLLSNPKVLLFLAAFLPQFVQPHATAPALQILLLGGIFMVIAAFTDTLYVLAASRAERFAASPGGSRTSRRLSGGLLVGGGLWLALAGRVEGQ